MIDTTADYLHDDDLADPELAELFATLHAQGVGTAPAMGAELAAILGTASAPTDLVPRRDRRTARRVGVAALLATGLVGAGVGAAAAGVLPDSAQRVVSDVVGRLTRVELPRPSDGRHLPPEQSPAPSPATRDVPDEDAGTDSSDVDGGGGAGRTDVTSTPSPATDEDRDGDGSTREDEGRQSGGDGSGSSGAGRDSSGGGADEGSEDSQDAHDSGGTRDGSTGEGSSGGDGDEPRGGDSGSDGASGE